MPEWFSFIDLLVIAVVLLFSLGGFQKGFAGQLAQLISFALFTVALLFAYPHLFGWVEGFFSKVSDRSLMWMLVLLFLVAGLIGYILINKLLAACLQLNMSDSSDRFLGMVLGLLRGGFIVLFLMTFSVMLGPVNIYQVLSKNGWTGRLVCYEVVPRVQPQLTRSSFDARVRAIRANLRNQEEAGDVGF
jgi:uncharacterized membrane protein required for colicin V production